MHSILNKKDWFFNNYMTIIMNKKKVPSTWKKNSLYLTSCNFSGKFYKSEINSN